MICRKRGFVVSLCDFLFEFLLKLNLMNGFVFQSSVRDFFLSQCYVIEVRWGMSYLERKVKNKKLCIETSLSPEKNNCPKETICHQKHKLTHFYRFSKLNVTKPKIRCQIRFNRQLHNDSPTTDVFFLCHSFLSSVNSINQRCNRLI